MSARSLLLLYWAGEARQTLMMSDRTLAFDSIPGGFLEVEFGSLLQYLLSLHYLCFCLSNLSAVLYLTASFHSTSLLMELAAAMIASEGG